MSKLSERIKQDKFQSLEQEAMLNLLIAAFQIRSENEKICNKYGITLPQYNILRILRGVHPEGHPRCEIITRMIEPAPDVTRILDRLIDKKLITRIEGIEDRRQSIATITAGGLTLLKMMDDDIYQMDNLLGKKLNGKELKELTILCEKIYS